MPLTPAVTDKFQKVGLPGSATTLSSPGYTNGSSTSITVGSTTNWPTDTLLTFAIDQAQVVNGVESRVPGTYCEFEGIVSSPTGIGNMTLKYGTAQSFPAGSLTRVYIPVSSNRENALIDGLNVDHNGKGNHKTLTDDNGNAWFTRTMVANAVNSLGASNAIAGSSPLLQAVGTDANIDITAVPKGLGGWKVKGRHDGWANITSLANFTYAGNNGQKEFLVNTSIDLSSFLYPGQKIALTRGTTPPTQSMAFTAASSQYATRSSVNGMTDTGTFTAEAWIYMNSNTANNTIMARDSGGAAGGWCFQVNSSGQLNCYWRNASGFSQFTSYQSIPLKRWVHVAAVATNIGTPAGSFYVNGALVPSTVNSTAATSRLQSGSLQVGAGNSGSFFDGYISEARYWATAQTQANIEANMAISLTGSETNLGFLAQGAGNFNDKTSNANNLTATNGAIATQAANPYNAIEYGILTKVTSSQLTIFTGTDYSVPNMTFSTVQYSTSKAPAGWPSSKYKWMVDYKYKAQISQAVTSTSAWLNMTGVQFSIPTGDFDADCPFFGQGTTGAAVGFVGSRFTLSTANNTQSNDELTGLTAITSAASTESDGPVLIKGLMSNSAQTTWYLNAQPAAVSGTTTCYLGANPQPAEFRFFSAYI